MHTHIYIYIYIYIHILYIYIYTLSCAWPIRKLRIVDSKLLGHSLRTWEFHPLSHESVWVKTSNIQIISLWIGRTQRSCFRTPRKKAHRFVSSLLLSDSGSHHSCTGFTTMISTTFIFQKTPSLNDHSAAHVPIIFVSSECLKRIWFKWSLDHPTNHLHASAVAHLCGTVQSSETPAKCNIR